MSTALMARLDFYAAMLKAGSFTRSALAVAFFLLYRHLNGNTGRCDPSISTLAKETSLTTRGVEKAISELKKSGWWRISREGTPARGGRTNAYSPRFETSQRPEWNGGSSGLKEANCSSGLPGERPEPWFAKDPNRSSSKPVKNQESDSRRAGARRRERVFRDPAMSEFEIFWQAYPARAPHSNPKKPAREKFEAAVKRGVGPAEMIAGAERYAAQVAAAGTEPRYVAQAATWLRQERWGDDHQQRPAEPAPLRIGIA
jgi:hypothetical protein